MWARHTMFSLCISQGTRDIVHGRTIILELSTLGGRLFGDRGDIVTIPMLKNR